MKKKLIIFSVVLVLLTGCIAACKRKDAAEHGLPLNRVWLSKMSGYTLLSEYDSIFSEHNTYIRYFLWGVTKPTARIIEFNPYNDYWICDENQAVIADRDAVIGRTGGKIYVRGKEKIPLNYHEFDKISKISVIFNDSVNVRQTLEAELDLTPDEIAEFEKMVFEEDERKYLNITFPDENEPLSVLCYIKDLEGLYYMGGNIRKYSDNKYYAVNGYRGAYGEVSDEISRKIEEAIQNKQSPD